MSSLPIKDFMTAKVTTVGPDTPLSEVAAQMSQSRLSCIVVVDKAYPIAVVTERDMTKLASELLCGESAKMLRDVMSPGLVTLNVNASCNEALELANKKRIRRMIIVDNDGKLAGVATQSDLLRAHAQDLEFQKTNLEIKVRKRTQELHGLNERLIELTRIDPMLEIGNRRSMDEELMKISERARRYNVTLREARVNCHRTWSMRPIDQLENRSGQVWSLSWNRDSSRVAISRALP